MLEVSQLSIMPTLVVTYTISGHKRVSLAVTFLFVAQVIDSMLYYKGISPVPFYHIYTLAEYIVFVSLLLSYELPRYNPPMQISMLFYALVGYTLINIYPQWDETIELTFVAGLAFLTLKDLMFYSLKTVDVRFWATIFILVYSFSAIPFMLMTLDKNSMSMVHAWINIISNMILTMGILICKYRTKHSRQYSLRLSSY